MKERTARYWLKLFVATLVSVLLALFILTLYYTHRWTWGMLHPARIEPNAEFLTAQQIPFEDVTLTTQDGLKLSAWYTPPQNGTVILVAHGYNDKRPEHIHAMFVLNGYGVLSFDFRAHGESEGDISTLGYYERMDVKAALDFALAQEDVEHVGAWGGSMGAATVILAAAENSDIEAVVADSAYPSLDDVLRLNMPIKPFQPFVFWWGEYYSSAEIDDVNPEQAIRKISPRPVFVIDGWEGGAVIMNSPYRLFDAAQEPKEIWVEDNIPHLGMYGYNPQKYEARVIQFFDEWLLNQK